MQATLSTSPGTPGLSSHLRTTALRFRPGQLIFDEGQKATRWYEVLRGTVRTCRFHMDGNRHLTGFFFSGDVFGADYGYYGTAAEAVTEVTVRCYRVGDIATEQRPAPHLDETVSMLFRAMSSAQRYLFIMGHRTASEKLAAFLLCLQQQAADDQNIRLPMSRSDIADFLGLTIHTISRTFSDLARRGLIIVNGRHAVAIADYGGLCRLAGEYQDSSGSSPCTDVHPAADICLGNRTAA
ncbi:helix-turn-helix domain-containing protein [Parasphingorhabdus sp.]|uniref:helix-turn-helix domain-containing protein n=1 Tax=Parasphingorhabdus sp. TaxID=2709688 RepID=UPI003267383D